MDREQLFSAIVAARPGRDDVVYLERRGGRYDWRVIPPEVSFIEPATTPDVWISLTADWPIGNRVLMRRFFDELLVELESMAGQVGRRRCPATQPHPRQQ